MKYALATYTRNGRVFDLYDETEITHAGIYVQFTDKILGHYTSMVTSSINYFCLDKEAEYFFTQTQAYSLTDNLKEYLKELYPEEFI